MWYNHLSPIKTIALELPYVLNHDTFSPNKPVGAREISNEGLYLIYCLPSVFLNFQTDLKRDKYK